MRFIDNLTIFFLIFLLNLILFYNFNKLSKFLNIYDKPDDILKKHSKTAFPLGGIILYLNLTLLFIIDLISSKLNIYGLDQINLIIFFITISLIFLLGFFDDKFNFNYSIKFYLLSIILVAILLFDKSLQINELRLSIINLQISIDYIQVFITTFFILLFINALNMFDGINLQLGLYTLIISFFLFYINPNNIIFLYIIFFLIFFLFYNYFKNVFLGNSGSMVISFILSYYFIKYYNFEYFTYSENIYIFMCIPGLDMFRLFIERILKNKNPFKGDNNHIHHILVKNIGFLKSTVVIQLLILTSILLSFYNLNLSILISLIIYVFILTIYKKKK
jgi:UDP-GlcNAc:undecaprenyl-phosphate/decaprenyl-phosphate GlcNAc-1-phosphate transferase